jgi:hypothetical protein
VYVLRGGDGDDDAGVYVLRDGDGVYVLPADDGVYVRGGLYVGCEIGAVGRVGTTVVAAPGFAIVDVERGGDFGVCGSAMVVGVYGGATVEPGRTGGGVTGGRGGRTGSTVETEPIGARYLSALPTKIVRGCFGRGGIGGYVPPPPG